jgi:PTS system cellobiose-specific IIC component
MFVVIVFALLLWTVGVHGTMIVYPFLIPVMIGAITTNAGLVAQGQAPVFNAAFLFGACALAGGTGNTLGLALLSKFKAKSEQLKAIGNVSFVPGVFGVNEPVIFGLPIAFNPILAIPFVLQGLIIAIIMWAGYSVGFLTPGFILIMSLMPIGIGEFLSTLSWKNALFSWLMVPVSTLIYYPFFKAYDAQLVIKEAEAKK